MDFVFILSANEFIIRYCYINDLYILHVLDAFSHFQSNLVIIRACNPLQHLCIFMQIHILIYNHE